MLKHFILLVMIGIVTGDDEAFYEAFPIDSNQEGQTDFHETEFELPRKNCRTAVTEDYVECPVDGNWSPWKSWSKCQGKCGKPGKRFKIRTCDNPAPANGGASCIGPQYGEEPCPSFVECTFDQYLQEGKSGLLNAKQMRLLQYLQNAQLHNSRFTELFGTLNTDISEIVSVLASDSSQLTDVSYEVDMYWEALICVKYNTGCPEEGNWLEWGDWSPCNAYCGGGISLRIRECTGAAHPSLDCIGSPFETIACNTHPCPPYSVNVYDWSTWSVWYGCHSPKCTGKHFKYREHCCQEKNPGNGIASQASGRRTEAEMQFPIIEMDFSQEALPRSDNELSLNIVDQPYISSQDNRILNSKLVNELEFPHVISPRRRFRRFAEDNFMKKICQPAPPHYVCSGASFEVEECETENLGGCNGNPFWSSWSEWSCSVICGIGQSRRWRACLAQNMANPLQWTSCPGPYVQNSACYPRPCSLKIQDTAKFDGLSSSIWYYPTKMPSQMFRLYLKLKPQNPEGTILWRARPNTQECLSTLSKCSKALHVYLRAGHVHFKAHYKGCSLELESDQPLQMNNWEELSVSIESWIGRLRIGSSPMIVSSNLSCNGESDTRQASHPNWDMRTSIGSKDGKSDFFSGAISHLAVNFLLWPLTSAAQELEVLEQTFAQIRHSQNVEIVDGDWEEHVKRIAPDENVLVYPDKGSSRIEFSLAFKTMSSEGLVLTMEGDDGVISLFYKVFLESSHLHLLFQCFHETFTLSQSQDYPECFVEETNPQTIEPGTWYLMSVVADSTTFRLTINTESSAKLSHGKKFNLQYISLGWSKSSEKEGLMVNKASNRDAWTKSMEISIAEFQLMDTNETPKPIELDELSIFENSYASLFTSSVSESYSELIHVANEPLVLSCELPSLTFDEQDEVIWIKSGQVIASESGALEIDRTVVERRSGLDDEQVFVSVLNLTPRKSSDSGFYSCVVLRHGRSQTLRTFGITIVDHTDSEAEAMTAADSSSFYITIAVIALGAVFLLLVVCGSAIFFCRKGRTKPKRLSISIDVSESEYSSQGESMQSESTEDRRNSSRKSSLRFNQDVKSTTINMESVTDAETRETGERTTEPTTQGATAAQQVKVSSAERHVNFKKLSPRESPTAIPTLAPRISEIAIPMTSPDTKVTGKEVKFAAPGQPPPLLPNA